MKNPPKVPAPVIQARDLCICYRGVPAVHRVDLEIAPRQITAFIGPSGCGKTSLLSAFNRMTDLVPGCTVTGSLSVAGVDLRARRVDLRALRRRVGMIFQKPNPFPLSVARNIELPLIEHGVARGERGAVVERVLRDVGLWEEVRDRLHGPALGLSGGQQQRLCIARALALAPEVLLMDEPCSALDPISSGVVEDLILRLRDRYTVVVVTHNLQQARRIADVTGVFWTEEGLGRLVELGPTKAVFGAPKDPRAAAYVRGLRG